MKNTDSDVSVTQDLAKISNTLAFFRSAILSGESWSETCNRDYVVARDALVNLSQSDTAKDARIAAFRGRDAMFLRGLGAELRESEWDEEHDAAARCEDLADRIDALLDENANEVKP